MTGMAISCGCKEKNTNTAHQSEDPAMHSRHDQDREERPVIAAFGDSLTAGAGVYPERNYPSKLQEKIDKSGYYYTVVNAGISGETSSQGLERLQSICVLHPAIVIIEFGANDGLRRLPLDVMERNLSAMVSGIHASGAKVILSGMRVPAYYGLSYADSFSKVFQQVAQDHNIALIPFFLENVGGKPHLNQADGIHPTAEGYDIVVETVWQVLEPMLQSAV
jgi:acyl-CoA thioesterase I